MDAPPSGTAGALEVQEELRRTVAWWCQRFTENKRIGNTMSHLFGSLQKIVRDPFGSARNQDCLSHVRVEAHVWKHISSTCLLQEMLCYSE